MSELVKPRSPAFVVSMYAVGFPTCATSSRLRMACAAFCTPAARPTRGSGACAVAPEGAPDSTIVMTDDHATVVVHLAALRRVFASMFIRSLVRGHGDWSS